MCRAELLGQDKVDAGHGAAGKRKGQPKENIYGEVSIWWFATTLHTYVCIVYISLYSV